jgi:integrase
VGRPMTRIRLDYIHEYRDRHGRVRRYVRKPGAKKVALPGFPGSAEFMAAYAEAINNRPASRHGDGTVGALVTGFMGSVEFTNLKPKSQRLYRMVLERFATQDGHRMVHDMPPEKARKIVEEIGSKRPGMGNLTRAVLRKLFEYAIDTRQRTDNPFARIKAYKLGSHHTWTDAELDQYEAYWQIGTRERLAYELLLGTTQRVGDVATLSRHDVKTGAFNVVQEKTGAVLTIPIRPRLMKAIKATPAKGVNVIGDPNGRPMSAGALSKMMESAIEKAGLPARCVAHGLRKAGLRILAEHGASTHEIKAMSGHRSIEQVQGYTEKADQARLARSAVKRVPNKRGKSRG